MSLRKMESVFHPIMKAHTGFELSNPEMQKLFLNKLSAQKTTFGQLIKTTQFGIKNSAT